MFPTAAEQSLILRKASGQAPHGGGRLFAPDSEAYEVLKQWIGQGMPVGDDQAPTLQALEIVPARARPRPPVAAAVGRSRQI